MSVVVWDGKTLAADRKAVCNGHQFATSKSRQLVDGTVLAWTGTQPTGLLLAEWYEAGEDRSKWPASQQTEEWAQLIVVTPNGKEVFEYGNHPVRLTIESVPFAWGMDKKFALGALAMGADARKAVEITNRLCDSCGFGVDAYDVNLSNTVFIGGKPLTLPWVELDRVYPPNLKDCTFEEPPLCRLCYSRISVNSSHRICTICEVRIAEDIYAHGMEVQYERISDGFYCDSTHRHLADEKSS